MWGGADHKAISFQMKPVGEVTRSTNAPFRRPKIEMSGASSRGFLALPSALSACSAEQIGRVEGPKGIPAKGIGKNTLKFPDNA